MVKIPDEKNESDLQFLESQFRTLFAYHSNVSITITFHKFNVEWEDYIELTDDDAIENKDKLKVVVTPRIVTPGTASQSDVVSTIVYNIHHACVYVYTVNSLYTILT